MICNIPKSLEDAGLGKSRKD